MTELLAALQDSTFSTWLRESTSVWAYPTVLTLHTVGLAVLVGVNTAFDLRLLGLGRGVPLDAIEKWFPAMWVGFWINAITGAMLFAIDPITKGMTVLFASKLALVAVGVILIVVMRRAVYRPHIAPTPQVSFSAKSCAVLSLFVWIAAMATGRFMAYV